MATQVSEVARFRCPLCGKSLAGDEYTHAMKELQAKVSEQYDKQSSEEKQKYEDELKKLKESDKTALNALKKGYEKQGEAMRKQLEISFKKQYETLEKQYGKMSREADQRYKKLEKSLKAEHKNQLLESSKKIRELQNEKLRIKKQAQEEAMGQARKEIDNLKLAIGERDLQIKRANNDLESLKKQLAASQGERKGEAGEIDLYVTLTAAFPNDYFRRQRRGEATGDVIQQIRTGTGKPIDMPIVYDNKEANIITKKDVEKAKRYKNIHGTNYVIIVSNNLPKDIENRYFGEKDGILLVHSSIITEVARQIRNAVIEIAKQSDSRKDREAKESKLYDYIRSQDFARKMEALSSIYQKMTELQEREEKAHQRLWKDRKALQLQINETYVDITSGIDSIVQEKPPMEELSEPATQQTVIKKKKKAMAPENFAS
ncbi:MAG: DUF2130 domain-containing protein [Thaumarchaeota archaeon]|nr:DUF2130 domain-containing protein [Nitrososphaerota archaeon]